MISRILRSELLLPALLLFIASCGSKTTPTNKDAADSGPADVSGAPDSAGNDTNPQPDFIFVLPDVTIDPDAVNPPDGTVVAGTREYGQTCNATATGCNYQKFASDSGLDVEAFSNCLNDLCKTSECWTAGFYEHNFCTRSCTSDADCIVPQQFVGEWGGDWRCIHLGTLSNGLPLQRCMPTAIVAPGPDNTQIQKSCKSEKACCATDGQCTSDEKHTCALTITDPTTDPYVWGAVCRKKPGDSVSFGTPCAIADEGYFTAKCEHGAFACLWDFDLMCTKHCDPNDATTCPEGFDCKPDEIGGFTFHLCTPKSCTLDSDCPQGKFCDFQFNGSVTEPQLIFSCYDKTPAGKKFGESCDSQNPCENDGWCVGGKCSRVCKKDGDCEENGAKGICITEELALQDLTQFADAPYNTPYSFCAFVEFGANQTSKRECFETEIKDGMTWFKDGAPTACADDEMCRAFITPISDDTAADTNAKVCAEDKDCDAGQHCHGTDKKCIWNYSTRLLCEKKPAKWDGGKYGSPCGTLTNAKDCQLDTACDAGQYCAAEGKCAWRPCAGICVTAGTTSFCTNVCRGNSDCGDVTFDSGNGQVTYKSNCDLLSGGFTAGTETATDDHYQAYCIPDFSGGEGTLCAPDFTCPNHTDGKKQWCFIATVALGPDFGAKNTFYCRKFTGATAPTKVPFDDQKNSCTQSSECVTNFCLGASTNIPGYCTTLCTAAKDGDAGNCPGGYHCAFSGGLSILRTTAANSAPVGLCTKDVP